MLESNHKEISLDRLASLFLANYENNIREIFLEAKGPSRPVVCNDEIGQLTPYPKRPDTYIIYYDQPQELAEQNLILLNAGIRLKSRWAIVVNPTLKPCECRGKQHSLCHPRARLIKKFLR
jgi:hypothetical protein